jgi:hypothetical protein
MRTSPELAHGRSRSAFEPAVSGRSEEHRGTVETAVLLFHVHFEVNDVSAAEAELERDGFSIRARFAYVGREHRRFEPDELLDGARLRLSELEQGAVNVVLMPSRFPERRLGHFGVTADSDEHSAVLERAAELGLRSKPNEVRSFVELDRQLQLEISDVRRYDYGVEQLSALRLERLEIACRNPGQAGARLSGLVGPDLAARIAFRPGPERFAQLADWTLAA